LTDDRKMLDRCRRFFRLTQVEQKLLLESLVVLPLVALAMRLCGFAATQRGLNYFLPLPTRHRAGAGCPTSDVVRMVGAAARHGGWRSSCLQRSLVLWWLLRRQGDGADLRIGVRRLDGKLQAHAWVEDGGRVLNDDADATADFAPFDAPILPIEAERV
jgi:hypothetical protein